MKILQYHFINFLSRSSSLRTNFAYDDEDEIGMDELVSVRRRLSAPRSGSVQWDGAEMATAQINVCELTAPMLSHCFFSLLSTNI